MYGIVKTSKTFIASKFQNHSTNVRKPHLLHKYCNTSFLYDPVLFTTLRTRENLTTFRSEDFLFIADWALDSELEMFKIISVLGSVVFLGIYLIWNQQAWTSQVEDLKFENQKLLEEIEILKVPFPSFS